jgi:sialate O-acetylesterase
MLRYFTLMFSFALFGTTATAQLRLARIFGDHMVLQRQQTIPIWGWAAPGSTVSGALAGQVVTAKVGADGAWRLNFTPLEAGGPYDLVVKSKQESLTVRDVLLGEVWVCSGQSNMEWTVGQSNNAAAEIRSANYPQIRHFKVNHDLAFAPLRDLPEGAWEVCSPTTVGNFTGAGYFFAREITQKLNNIPVGLMHTSWGGSQAEGWISRGSLATSEVLKNVVNTLPDTWEACQKQLDARNRMMAFNKADMQVTAADEALYTAGDYDLSTWKVAGMPGALDWMGFQAFRGRAYLGRDVDIPAGFADQGTQLSLAENDSECMVWINGKKVWTGPLSLSTPISLPAGTWKAGANRLMVHVGTVKEQPWFGVGLRSEGKGKQLFLTNPQGEFLDFGGHGWHLRPSFAQPHEYIKHNNNTAATLYNAMLAPIIPMAMRGVLWYQGETNAGRAYEYRHTFPLLIKDWRKQWGRDFPFYFVQLATYGYNGNSNDGSNWAELREAQTMTLTLPQTGMAVATDIGDPEDIHPTNKQDVGKRLALNALKKDYGIDVSCNSPMADSIVFLDSRVHVWFKYADKGLVAKQRYGYVQGFELAGSDRVFYYAQARIEGNSVEVQHPKVTTPVSVRYAWSDAPVDANLFSAEGLPVVPFRSDNWPGKTEKEKFKP